jgi:hypothetical protein
LYGFLIAPTRATCPAHFILIDLITLIIFGEVHKLRSSSLCRLLQPPATSTLLGPNILSPKHPVLWQSLSLWETELKRKENNFIRFNIYILILKTRRQKLSNCMVASIPRILSAVNLFMRVIFISFQNIWTLPNFPITTLHLYKSSDRWSGWGGHDE